MRICSQLYFVFGMSNRIEIVNSLRQHLRYHFFVICGCTKSVE